MYIHILEVDTRGDVDCPAPESKIDFYLSANSKSFFR